MQNTVLSTIIGECLQNTPEYGVQAGEEGGVIRLDRLYLIPKYTFSCHGKVTQWKACVENRQGQEIYTIFFYVLRPTSPAQPDCYSLVGIDRLIDAIPTDSCVTMDVLVNQTSVQPGDVVGVIPMSNTVSNGIKIDSSVTGGVAWHAPVNSLTAGVGKCEFKTSPDGNMPFMVAAAPIITAVVGEPCI